ncbi:TPA: hypothetical protein L5Q11_005098 [Pseudomonas aeruginosa]|nr:hypothetical protein [Pseudomonas aeruginosa]
MSRAPKRQLADRIAEADALASRWLADGHAAGALGDTAKAEHCYAKSQFWKDRYNLLTGSGDRPAPKA